MSLRYLYSIDLSQSSVLHCPELDQTQAHRKSHIYTSVFCFQQHLFCCHSGWVLQNRSSCRLQNPGKSVFLSIAADSVRGVNEHRDRIGVSYSGKEMVLCGLSLSYCGRWEERLLSSELQGIIAQLRSLSIGTVWGFCNKMTNAPYPE